MLLLGAASRSLGDAEDAWVGGAEGLPRGVAGQLAMKRLDLGSKEGQWSQRRRGAETAHLADSNIFEKN